MRAGLAGLVCAVSGPSRADEPLSLSLPVGCEIGRTCFVQNYADDDPGPGVKDYACQGATYEGHDGTDFRVVSTAAGEASVLAAAPGVVKGVRDGMADQFVSDGGRDAIKGRECGNGLVINHGNGWETQYCHLRKESLVVKPGQSVLRGQRLGAIGYSGLVDFAHVHLSVRFAGKPVDPFFYPREPGTCAVDPTTAPSLWDDAARRVLAYRDGLLIWAGFSGKSVSNGELERGQIPPEPTRASPALILIARAINVRTGDQVHLRISGPKGTVAETTTKPIDRHMAVSLSVVGARLQGAAQQLPTGPYTGLAEVLRGGAVISSLTSRLELRD